uniref:Uncharacterized protein n=1 Tax=Rhizophora mucronata TaxID=61149 RepID=A0A2P2IKF8_RHIMU
MNKASYFLVKLLRLFKR